jgi:hypothetical protein
MSVRQYVTPGQWHLLRSGAPGPGEVRAAPAGVNTDSGPVLYALDKHMRRHLLVPVASSEEIVEDAQSRGCRVSRRQLIGHASVHYADLACLASESEDVFSLLINDVLDRLERRASPPGSAGAEALGDWRALLGGGLGLGEAELTGLFGELWVLRRLAAISASAVESWLGPLGAPHDFRSGDNALEVKTTVSATGTACRIHGVTQLQPPEGGLLHLGLARMERRPGDGERISDLVEAVLACGVSRSALEERLTAIGFDQSNASTLPRWRVSQFQVWTVDASFPRLVPSSFDGGSVPAGVSSLNYVIDLSAAGSPLREDRAADLMQSLSGRSAK